MLFRLISKGLRVLEKSSGQSEIGLEYPLLARIYPSAETWPSGRRRSPAKGVGPEGSRGFESLRLRQTPQIF